MGIMRDIIFVKVPDGRMRKIIQVIQLNIEGGGFFFFKNVGMSDVCSVYIYIVIILHIFLHVYMHRRVQTSMTGEANFKNFSFYIGTT